jgi:NADH:ubiquinone oxidoreductase subunit B-like Fe-S oxidoreductase
MLILRGVYVPGCLPRGVAITDGVLADQALGIDGEVAPFAI